MHKTWFVVILAIAIISVRSTSAYSEKITSDPNTQGKHNVSTQATDSRLLMKITYDSDYKRLHTVVSDITRLSGVSIICGSSKNDWQVRDIPVVVCVKDIPLGKLLRALADATHTRFSSEKFGDNSKLSYRIYRNKKDQDSIDNYLSQRHETMLNETKWQWDAMVAFGNPSLHWKPEALIDQGNPKEHHDSPQRVLLIARLIAMLGPDAKAKMLNGETFSFSGKDPTYQTIMSELYQLTWTDIYKKNWRDTYGNMLPVDYLEALKRKLDGPGIDLDEAVHISMLPKDSFYTWLSYTHDFEFLDVLQRYSNSVMWRLYDALEPSDKLIAKSKDGLSLGKFDAAWIANFFRQRKLESDLSVIEGSSAMSGEKHMLNEADLMEQVISNPKTVSTMIMRVLEEPAETHSRQTGKKTGVKTSTSDTTKQYTYDIQISYNLDGENMSVDVKGPGVAYPFKSQK